VIAQILGFEGQTGWEIGDLAMESPGWADDIWWKNREFSV
jgi:hypothetical protein